MNLRVAIIFVIIVIWGFSCRGITEEKFDKAKWNYYEDPAFPPSHRKKMIKDLTTNYKLSGMSYSELVALLGKPNFRDSLFVGYEADVDYGRDIDPVYIKNLLFTLSKDSIITSFRVHEWKK